MIFDERDVRFEVFSGHGPGGQARNKVQKCVRAIHDKFGLMAVATRERSLRQNKKAALEVLRANFELLRTRQKNEQANAARLSKPAPAFGSSYVRTYRLLQPASVVDHATGETFGVEVLDGNLDEVIRARLAK